MSITFPYELANGSTADADEVMANFNEIKNNFDTDTVDDASANATEMQATADPYPGASESLATNLRGELKRLRYQVDSIIGKTQWYEDPDTSLLLEFNKGADIASASALALGTDGNYFDVTGTTAITSINTRRVGSVIKLHFDGILTLTHHATNLALPGGVNITTAAGDEAEFTEYATGDWRCTNYSFAGGGLLTHNHTGGIGAQIPQDGLLDYVAGDVLSISDDNLDQAVSTTYIKVKGITIIRGGTLRVKFSLAQSGAGAEIAYGQIYVNGSPVGIERSSSSTTPVEYSEDISDLSAQDEIQIYGKRSASASNITNFRLYVSLYHVNTITS